MHTQTHTAPLCSAHPVLATRDVITLSLPAHWLCAVLYGDMDIFADNNEATAFLHWLNDTREELGHGHDLFVGNIKDQEYFARYHDAAEYGVLPCMCVDVDLICER